MFAVMDADDKIVRACRSRKAAEKLLAELQKSVKAKKIPDSIDASGELYIAPLQVVGERSVPTVQKLTEISIDTYSVEKGVVSKDTVFYLSDDKNATPGLSNVRFTRHHSGPLAGSVSYHATVRASTLAAARKYAAELLEELAPLSGKQKSELEAYIKNVK